MTRPGFFSTALILLAFGVWFSGCSNDDSISGIAEVQPLVVSVSPQNGTKNVPISSSIIMTFNTPMDTISVMEHFHCSGGDEMWEWMDSLQHHGPGHGGHMGRMDHMMEWMRDIELSGEFDWNAEMTECVFHPDTGFLAHTDYMIYLEGDVRSRGGMMMDMHRLQYDGLMIHFRTGP
ncbi:MAG: hypothetical protein GTO51_07705 [Candidatus Latescibacteria bacterium]|nr:hypothetical protein [Candidatus Latescibacterota bacterium]NIO29249.1 hypothetical protein [Candidatus Latescibacterota bacterium]NIO56873.1 hypothetical protein [Candidatus Latescibacterota bacterium]